MASKSCVVCFWISEGANIEGKTWNQWWKICKKHEHLIVPQPEETDWDMPTPKPRTDKDFERIKPEHLDEWIAGHIEEVRFEEAHEFKGLFAKTCEAVQFKLRLEGYNEPKYSRWYPFSYSEKANIYKTWILPLVDGAYEYFDFDIDLLKDARIKVMFGETVSDGKPYQNIKMVKANAPKIKYTGEPNQKMPKEELPTIQIGEEDESVPF